MVKTSKLQGSLILLILCFCNIHILKAQMVGANAYIKGTSVEIGIAGAGGYEGAPIGVSPPPAGMHYRSSTGFFGFVSNPQVNLWTTFDGDFFTPGTPENGWGIELPSGLSYGNNCTGGLNQIPGAMTSWSQTFTCISADWQGDLTTGTNLHFKVNYFLNQNDLFYTTTVSITNNTGATIPTLYYYRNLDPDNNQSISGDFYTQNTIVAQPFSGLCNTAHVKATSLLPAGQPMSYFGLAATGANWRAFYGGFSNRDGSDLWTGAAGFTQAVGSTLFVDGAIGLAYRITNLAPGATETFKFVSILDDLAAAQAVANTTFLTYPGSATAPPSACTPYTDTAKICQGVPATIGVSGPNIGSYNWSWSPTTGLSPATGPSVSASPATTTTYTVTGTPINACFAAISFPIVVYVTPSPTVVPEANITVCAGAVVPLNTFTSTPAGAAFAWTNSNTGIGLAGSGTTSLPSFTATNAGTTPITSTITVTPSVVGSTCPGVAGTFTITVNPNPVVNVNSLTVCPGQTAVLTATGATSYLWNTGSTANPLSVNPTTTTSYTVTGTTATCTSTAVSTVTVGGSVSVAVNSPNICSGAAATLTATGATTYTWSTGSTANPLSVSPTTTTSYTVTGNSSGCTGTAVATVTIAPGITPTASLNDSVCFGGSTVLGVTPNGAGYSYSWTPAASLTGATTDSPTASPTATTTYSVLVTDAGGCTGTSTVTIFADPQITLAIAGIDVTCNGACNGQTIVIPAGGTPAYTYAWSSGCTAASCSSLCPNTYTVTVTDSWGCTAAGTATVIEPTLLTASVSAATPASCNGVCDGTATAAGAGGTVGAGYSYSWNTVPVQTTATATALCAGSYTCTVTDANGCTTTSSTTITEPTLVVIAPITAATICTGGSTSLTASASGGNPGGYNYTWAPAGTGSTATVIVSPAATTVYTVTATDVLNNCPAAPVTVTVTVNPGLSVVAAGTASICPGASTNISAAGSLGNGGPYTYTWAPAGTGMGSPVSVSPAVTTTYTVTASDGCSPTATATVTITVLPTPVVSFSAPTTTGCAPLCVNFTDNSTVSGAAISTWAWAFGDGNTASTATPSNCYTTPGNYDVTLTVTSTVGGCSSSSTVINYVSVYPNPVAAFTAPLSTSIMNPVVSYTDNSTISSGSIASWNWNFGDPFSAATDSTSTLQNPTHVFTEADTYCTTLVVTSNFGCVDNTQVCLVIEPEFTFFLPNAFSPNGDGINDEFYGKGDYINDFEMSIFDRWGNLIFFSDDINKHWDGKANHGGELAQQDVYIYSVKITDHHDKKHKYMGTVTIVK